MSDESDFEIGEEIDSKKHDKIVEEVLNLNKVQNVKKPSRTEPSLNISEFNLVKSVTNDQGSVHLNALSKVLKGRKNHEIISSKLQSTSGKSKTLPAPLEKPQADRIRRTLNYEKSRLKLDRWEALVTANRAATQLTFPLNSTEKLKIEEAKSETYPTTWRVKSELQKELEKLEPKIEEYHINQEEENFPLTLKELKERRKETAKLRAHQSYKEAKARRQNKIKSKKYHRILRREKIKQKLKEFEELQKTNPEEALKMLEDIEKARAEERFSLRHKGTGQWAKSKQIRAKYDKESRQVLAQQLAISRDLTQKLKNVQSDSEEEGADLEDGNLKENKDSSDNPWVSGIKPTKEITDFVSGYRKYWSEKNTKELEENTFENGSDLKATKKNKSDLETGKNESKSERLNIMKNKSKGSKNKKVQKVVQKKTESDVDNNELKSVESSNENLSVKSSNSKVNKIKNKRNTKSLKKDSIGTSEWNISLLEKGNDIEDIFSKLEDNLEKKVKVKHKKLKRLKKIEDKRISANNRKTETKKIDLSFPRKTKKPIIDEQMIEEGGNTRKNANKDNVTDENSSSDINSLKNILDTAVEREKSSDIDPHKFLNVKTTNLSTAIPDILTTDENEENNNQRDVILEAFEDDDIAEEFKKEKEGEVKKDTPGDIDLNLPGWGSWGGTNIVHRKRRRRFITKMPPKIPRKDDNKGSLIINEKAQSKIKPHMVTELPFPFKSVKDYEASIRAPIGNSFVPETAFRKLIEPAVVTKMGTIIEPITKSILIGEKKM